MQPLGSVCKIDAWQQEGYLRHRHATCRRSGGYLVIPTIHAFHFPIVQRALSTIFPAQVQRLAGLMSVQIEALRAKQGHLRDEFGVELAAAYQEAATRLDEVSAKCVAWGYGRLLKLYLGGVVTGRRHIICVVTMPACGNSGCCGCTV